MVQEELRSSYKRIVLSCVAALMTLAGCGGVSGDGIDTVRCSVPAETAIAGTTGTALVFTPDPIVDSGRSSLTPDELDLDGYRTTVELSNLSGRGVLEGKFVEVRNGLDCQERFSAYSEMNEFNYEHLEPGFQEAMSYYYGDAFRSSLAEAGAEYLLPERPVRIVAHCMRDDNAYYERYFDPHLGQVLERVCLGDSAISPGASYADDASVVVHELQHATTVHSYSTKEELNRFWYDEAGSLNEAVSDFVALSFLAPSVPNEFDPKLFSRWALATFIPDMLNTRGAHKCPTYDSRYPECGEYPAFSADRNGVSYVYPDGLGWPFANNFDGPGFVSSAFTDYRGQEEIHNAGMVLTGAIWDAYEGVKANQGGDEKTAYSLMIKATMKALALLPKPTLVSQSPVTFRGLIEVFVDVAPAVGFTSSDLAAASAAFTARGLLGGDALTPGWAEVGPGAKATPGVKILDNSNTLGAWFARMGARDPRIVTQGIDTGLNGVIDAGEVFAIWFDIANGSDRTAGGLQVTAISSDPDLEFLDSGFNIGAISSQMAQIRYGKVNGSSIVSALASSSSTFHVPTGATYFRTNPHFDRAWTTAFFMQARPGASPGKTVTLTLQIKPVNGSTESVSFPVTIN